MERYTADYTTKQARHWSHWFHDLVGRPNLELLEIGSFEGRSARWLLDHLCAHEDSRLTCVDIFSDPDAEARFDHNIALSPRAGQVRKHRSTSHDWLVQQDQATFDLIYVDGSHRASDVLLDAMLSWRLLKRGGRLLFDDYLWALDKKKPLERPQLAVDLFLSAQPAGMTLLYRGYQVLVAKDT